VGPPIKWNTFDIKRFFGQIPAPAPRCGRNLSTFRPLGLSGEPMCRALRQRSLVRRPCVALGLRAGLPAEQRLTERYLKGLKPKLKNIIVYDVDVVGFGV
jgi:hypothetical protein